MCTFCLFEGKNCVLYGSHFQSQEDLAFCCSSWYSRKKEKKKNLALAIRKPGFYTQLAHILLHAVFKSISSLHSLMKLELQSSLTKISIKWNHTKLLFL